MNNNKQQQQQQLPPAPTSHRQTHRQPHNEHEQHIPSRPSSPPLPVLPRNEQQHRSITPILVGLLIKMHTELNYD